LPSKYFKASATKCTVIVLLGYFKPLRRENFNPDLNPDAL